MLFVVLVKAKVKLKGLRESYSSTVLADSGARMTLVDRALADHLGVEYTGREISFISISGHSIKALEAIVAEFEVEGEKLKYEPVAISEIPGKVKDALRSNNLDENIILGVLTMERRNMTPDIATGKLRKVESFIF